MFQTPCLYTYLLCVCAQLSGEAKLALEWSTLRQPEVSVQEMEVICTKAITDNPMADESVRGQLFLRRAKLREALDKSQEGIADLDEAYRLNPSDPDILLSKGRGLIAENKLKESEEIARTLKERFSNKPYGWYLEAGRHAFEFHDGFGDAEKALEGCAVALQKDPGYVPAWALRSVVCAQLGRMEDAVAAAQMARTLPPPLAYELTIAFQGEAMGLWKLRRLDEAVAAMIRVRDQVRRPEAEQYAVVLWRAYVLQNRSETALWHARREAVRLPENPEVHAELALSLAFDNDLEGAMRTAERSVDLGKLSATTWNALGRVRCLKGDFAGSVEAFKSSMAIGPRNTLDGGIALDSGLRLAFLQATCPDESLRDGEKAHELCVFAYKLLGRSRHWSVDAIEACGYAEGGQFEMAMKAVKSARAAAKRADVDATSLDVLEQAFKSRLPYRLSDDRTKRGFDLPILQDLIGDPVEWLRTKPAAE